MSNRIGKAIGIFKPFFILRDSSSKSFLHFFFSFIFVFGGEILTVSAAIFCCKFLVVRFTIFHLLLAGFDFLVFFFLLHTVFFSLLEIIWKISKIGKFVAIFKRRP